MITTAEVLALPKLESAGWWWVQDPDEPDLGPRPAYVLHYSPSRSFPFGTVTVQLFGWEYDLELSRTPRLQWAGRINSWDPNFTLAGRETRLLPGAADAGRTCGEEQPATATAETEPTAGAPGLPLAAGREAGPRPLSPALAWFHRTKERDHVISLCAGHAYLAGRGWKPGFGSLYGLHDKAPSVCCVCAGTATIQRMREAPLKSSLP